MHNQYFICRICKMREGIKANKCCKPCSDKLNAVKHEKQLSIKKRKMQLETKSNNDDEDIDQLCEMFQNLKIN